MCYMVAKEGHAFEDTAGQLRADGGSLLVFYTAGL